MRTPESWLQLQTNRPPKVYIAAAFRQFSNWEGPSSAQAYGEIIDPAYVELLEAIELEFMNFGFATCLPHRDEGRWGAVYYEPPAISALCFRHVATSDVIFALAEGGRGVHLELGFAGGLGHKPMILMHREGTEPSTLLWGLPGLPSAWEGIGLPATTTIKEYGDRDDLLRSLRQTLQNWWPDGQAELPARDDAHIALVDIGSHSVKFQIQRRRGRRLVEVVSQARSSMRLIDHVSKTGRLSREAIGDLVALLVEWKAKSDTYACHSVAVIGTAALRRASNVEELTTAIKSALGWKLEILDPDKELGYAYQAVAAEFDDSQSIAVLNVGGGSVQLGVGSGQRIHARGLLDFGTKDIVGRWPWDSPITDSDYTEMKRFTADKLRAELRTAPHASRLIHTGGELDFLLRCVVPMRVSALSATHVSEIATADFATFADQLRRISRAEASKRFGLDPSWAIGSVASNVFALAAAETFSCEAIIPSNLNVSDGIALDRLA